MTRQRLFVSSVVSDFKDKHFKNTTWITAGENYFDLMVFSDISDHIHHILPFDMLPHFSHTFHLQQRTHMHTTVEALWDLLCSVRLFKMRSFASSP